tara:strand:- start:24905 stop:25294 length:390 start_codon:yes stop_codon:yes gene_type:complete
LTDAANSLRIDRWLFYCRFYKTRTLATAAVSGGHVEINGERATPGHRVRCGDRIDLMRQRLPYSIEVLAVPARRGPAAEAQKCFREDEQSIARRKQISAVLRRDRMLMPRTEGRPDKRTRRKLRERGRS